MSKTDPQHQPENLAFATELIKARNDVGLTQSQLASQSHVSLSAIKGYETGRNMPGARELRELCATLKVTPNKLLFGVESPFSPTGANDPAKSPGDKGMAVQRMRLAHLVSLLSFDESYAVYSLVHSIAVARHGEALVSELLTSADLVTLLERVSQGKPIDTDLFPKDVDFLRSFGTALKTAAAAAEKGQATDLIAPKVTKK